MAASSNPFSPSVTYSPDIRLISSPSSLLPTLFRPSLDGLSETHQRRACCASIAFLSFCLFFSSSLVNPSAVPDINYVDFRQNRVAFIFRLNDNRTGFSTTLFPSGVHNHGVNCRIDYSPPNRQAGQFSYAPLLGQLAVNSQNGALKYLQTTRLPERQHSGRPVCAGHYIYRFCAFRPISPLLLPTGLVSIW